MSGTNIPRIYLFQARGKLPFVVRRDSWPPTVPGLLILDVSPRATRNGWFGEVTGFSLSPRSEDEYWGTEENPIEVHCSGCYQWSLVPIKTITSAQILKIIDRYPTEQRELPQSVLKAIEPKEDDELLWFGKYKGIPIGSIKQKDPSYIQWARQKGLLTLARGADIVPKS